MVRRLRGSLGTLSVSSALCASVPVHAQCQPVWSGVNGGADWEVRALEVFDEDGSGPRNPALFIGGGFLKVAGIESFICTRWDGWSASMVGGGLHASFYGVASMRAVPEPVGAIPAGLYVGGEIDGAGGMPANNIVGWTGSVWHDAGGGVTRSGISIPYVFAMQVFDEDGEGPKPPALFAGGQFEFAGGVPVDGLARWDGREWSEVGGGLADTTGPGRVNVFAMTVYDDGRGPALYVAGGFNRAGGEPAYNIARWDGSSWEAVGRGLSTTVESLCVFDEDGPGPKRPALFAGGQFSKAVGGEPQSLIRIARWDGSEWTDVGGWLSDGVVRAMQVWDVDGDGPEEESLYIGGKFNILPDLSPVSSVARWDGEAWHDVGGGVTGFGTGTGVSALGVFDEDGPGPNPGGLYAGGLFYRAGGVETKHVARFGCPLPASPPCYADCDGDGELTFFDFLCFQNAFAAGCP